MNRAQIVDHYLDKLSRPGFEFYQVRAELESNHVDEEEIKIIVWLVDNEIQRRVKTQDSNYLPNALIWIGTIITAFGAIITIGTYTGVINTGNRFIIAYGPFLAGLSILVSGLAKRNTFFRSPIKQKNHR